MRTVGAMVIGLALVSPAALGCARPGAGAEPRAPRSATPTAPVPTAEYSSLEAVRDSVGAFVARAVAPGDTAIHVSHSPAMFHYEYVADSAAAWTFQVVVNDTSECPSSRIQKELTAAGWVPYYDYSADGPDGGMVGYVCRGYLCVVSYQWDGGDDSDSTYVPVPGCEVKLTCVPRRLDDAAPK